MRGSRKPNSISEPLRQAIANAIESGQTNDKALERETGVTRASIMRFVERRQFLRLDLADRLAAHFRLELRTMDKGK